MWGESPYKRVSRLVFLSNKGFRSIGRVTYALEKAMYYLNPYGKIKPYKFFKIRLINKRNGILALTDLFPYSLLEDINR